MTLEELERTCEEIEQEGGAGIRVIVSGTRYGRTCRLAPELTGENLGHYRDASGDVTHVWLKVEIIRKFLTTERRNDTGDR